MQTTKQATIGKRSPFARSRVSIIVPYHGQYEHVVSLVRSIVMATRSNPYEVVLVDDASPNAEFNRSMANVPQVRTVRSNTRLGFGGALNLGLRSTEQPWVMLLNSDCKVTDGQWMRKMGESLLDLREQNVRMVSAVLDNAGDGVTPKIGTSYETDDDYVVLTPEDGPMPLVCVMCHRELFNHVGGTFKEYPFGGYEDEEFAHRMRHHGFKQAVCRSAPIHHEGGVTIGPLFRNPAVREAFEGNRQRCIDDIRKIGA